MTVFGARFGFDFDFNFGDVLSNAAGLFGILLGDTKDRHPAGSIESSYSSSGPSLSDVSHQLFVGSQWGISLVDDYHLIIASRSATRPSMLLRIDSTLFRRDRASTTSLVHTSAGTGVYEMGNWLWGEKCSAGVCYFVVNTKGASRAQFAVSPSGYVYTGAWGARVSSHIHTGVSRSGPRQAMRIGNFLIGPYDNSHFTISSYGEDFAALVITSAGTTHVGKEEGLASEEWRFVEYPCTVSAWSSWSSCSFRWCGRGTQRRRRRITSSRADRSRCPTLRDVRECFGISCDGRVPTEEFPIVLFSGRDGTGSPTLVRAGTELFVHHVDQRYNSYGRSYARDWRFRSMRVLRGASPVRYTWFWPYVNLHQLVYPQPRLRYHLHHRSNTHTDFTPSNMLIGDLHQDYGVRQNWKVRYPGTDYASFERWSNGGDIDAIFAIRAPERGSLQGFWSEWSLVRLLCVLAYVMRSVGFGFIVMPAMSLLSEAHVTQRSLTLFCLLPFGLGAGLQAEPCPVPCDQPGVSVNATFTRSCTQPPPISGFRCPGPSSESRVCTVGRICDSDMTREPSPAYPLIFFERRNFGGAVSRVRPNEVVRVRSRPYGYESAAYLNDWRTVGGASWRVWPGLRLGIQAVQPEYPARSRPHSRFLHYSYLQPGRIRAISDTRSFLTDVADDYDDPVYRTYPWGPLRYRPASVADYYWATVGRANKDGQWGDFVQEGLCSAMCGPGTAVFRRQCDSPPPLAGGADCVGNATTVLACENRPCDPNPDREPSQ